MELKLGLSKPGRARFLRVVGKWTGGSAIDKSQFADSARDLGSMPLAQATIGRRATPQCAANKRPRRTGASSALAAFASDAPSETAQLSWRGAAAFSYRVRRLAPSGCSAFRAGELQFAPFRPAYAPRTGSCPTCLRWAE